MRPFDNAHGGVGPASPYGSGVTELSTRERGSVWWKPRRRGAERVNVERYTPGMASTTIKLSVETRERLRALGGTTYEDTVIEALDALEANRFWTEAEAAAAWQASLPEAERQRRHEAIAEIDRAFDGIE